MQSVSCLPSLCPTVDMLVSQTWLTRMVPRSVFEHVHKNEIRKAKDQGVMTSNQLETIVHPNEYFKRSYLLKNLGKEAGTDVKMEE